MRVQCCALPKQDETSGVCREEGHNNRIDCFVSLVEEGKKNHMFLSLAFFGRLSKCGLSTKGLPSHRLSPALVSFRSQYVRSIICQCSIRRITRSPSSSRSVSMIWNGVRTVRVWTRWIECENFRGLRISYVCESTRAVYPVLARRDEPQTQKLAKVTDVGHKTH